MTRSNYLRLALVVVSITTAAAFILPGSVMCPHSNCRPAVAENWDFSTAPERQLMTFASPEGLSTIPTR